MKAEKIIIYTLLSIALIAGIYIGYRAVQNGRYTPFGPGYNSSALLWDNWNDEVVFKEGEAEKVYNYYYTNKGKD